MAKTDINNKLKELGKTPNNLTSEDYYQLLQMQIKGEFGKDVFKEFVKQNNTTYKTFIDGLDKFSKTHNFTNDTLSRVLEWRIKELTKERNKAKTIEEKKDFDTSIEDVLDRLERLADKNRTHKEKIIGIMAGTAIIVAGSGLYLFTKNPALLKKGAEMIGKETLKNLVK
jgi:hypothetical protein